jgi:hypothetical protein
MLQAMTSPYYMVSSFLLSLFGMAIFIWGKNLKNMAIKYLGVLLMVIPVISYSVLFHGISLVLVIFFSLKLR